MVLGGGRECLENRFTLQPPAQSDAAVPEGCSLIHYIIICKKNYLDSRTSNAEVDIMKYG